MPVDILVSNCHDCQHELDVIHQPSWNGKSSIRLVTCWNPTCLLQGFTLSAQQYNTFTDATWEEYRALNRKRTLRVLIGEVNS